MYCSLSLKTIFAPLVPNNNTVDAHCLAHLSYQLLIPCCVSVCVCVYRVSVYQPNQSPPLLVVLCKRVQPFLLFFYCFLPRIFCFLTVSLPFLSSLSQSLLFSLSVPFVLTSLVTITRLTSTFKFSIFNRISA